MSKRYHTGWMLVIISLLVLFALRYPQVQRAETIGFVGRALHIVTEQPIAGATIYIGDQHAVTDDQGWYLLALPPGRYDVSANAPGYIGMTHKLRSVETGLATLDFAMIPREPDVETSRLIDEKLLQPAQELSDDLAGHILEEGDLLTSGLTQVPRTLRVLIRKDPAVALSEPVEVITMDFEEYLKGLLPSEMPAYWPEEALKAQAIAARSYAAANMGKHAAEGADVCSSVHCQVWKPTEYETTSRAVDATRGMAATYNGSIIYAFFSAHCDGHTRNNEAVWTGGAPVPYLRGVPCSCGHTTMLGHGVGLCQHGARAMALTGHTYDQILNHYYTGIDILTPEHGALIDARVEPATGDEQVLYAYRVTYYSDMGALPAVANVIINGRAHTMQRSGGDAASGWHYSYTASLPAGTHTYRFVFDDGYGRVTSAPFTGTFSGPTVATSALPPPATDTDHRYLTDSTALDWQLGQRDGVRIVSGPTDLLSLEAGRSQGVYTSPALTTGAPFVAYGFIWHAQTPGTSSVAFEARTSLDGTVWTQWQPLEGESYMPGTDDPQSAELVFGEALYIQYRARLSAGLDGEQPTLRDVSISCIDSREGPSAADLLSQSTVTAPTVISRAEWGANESWMTAPPEYRTVRAAIMHHTVTSDGGVDPAAIVRAIYRYHAIDREWGDIGYNYLVDHYGRIYEGRYGGTGVVGHHAGHYNYGSIGIGMIGDFQANPVPPALFDAVTTFLAYQFNLHSLDPLGQTFLIDKILPTIFGHRDVSNTACPGNNFYVLMGTVRNETLAKMAPAAPEVSLPWPNAGQAVRGVIHPQVASDSIITYMAYYVDGGLRAQANEAFAWKWNTTLETEGNHTLQVVAQNASGTDQAQVTVLVDNIPPTGTVEAPAWTSLASVPIAVTGTDAVSVAFSGGWTWEAEDMYQQPGTGIVVADAEAFGDYAVKGRQGQDSPGAWYGPYACVFPAGNAYQAVFRLKTDQYTESTGLATVDVADGAANMTYAVRPIAGNDFSDGAYQEFVLPFTYNGVAQSCQFLEPGKGIEFRTWYSGLGNLWLDRVSVFTAPQALAGATTWPAPGAEGLFPLTVRLLDQAGNATHVDLSVGIDRTPPAWYYSDGSGFWVHDPRSGLDVSRAAWAESHDGGQTWGAWQPLSLDQPNGTHYITLLYSDGPTGNRVRYRAVDLAGNEAISPALETGHEPALSPLLDRHVRLPLMAR